ncbi:hypothetical protein EK546_09325 [Salmonella enterica]|nr:hypothetical protein [Salmonella enterica]
MKMYNVDDLFHIPVDLDTVYKVSLLQIPFGYQCLLCNLVLRSELEIWANQGELVLVVLERKYRQEFYCCNQQGLRQL